MPRLAATILGLLLVTATRATPLELAAVSADQVQLSQDGLRATIEGYKSVNVGGQFELPAQTWYFELKPDETLAAVTILPGDTVELPYRFPLIDFHDLATSDSIPYEAYVQSSAQLEELGRVPVMKSVRSVGDRRWAVITLFPVTIDGSGRLILHRRVTVDVADREVFRSDFHSSDPAYDDLRRQSFSRAATANSNYLIVTAPDLLAPMQALAAYRRSLGYAPEIVLIDDITSSFPGRDDAERLRNYLRDYCHRGGNFVLLAGDETILPVRYAYHYSVSALPDPENLLLCDLYFAEVEADWDPDDDNIFGERDISMATVVPQLRVGRLPFSNAAEADAYVRKLIAYETNPGDGSYDYLNRAFFYASDQMRDLGDAGQHGAIAEVYPSTMIVDTTDGVETTSGDDPAPTNLTADATLDIVGNGYGIVNVVAHGRSDAFGVTTSGYNEWPKTYFITDDFGSPHGNCNHLPHNNRMSFYYSLACDVGGFDQDQPPMNRTQPNLVQTMLGLDSAGAVGFVAYSRWGWVGSSYLLQRSFFEELFADPTAPAVDAMYKSMSRYYFYRDLVYSQNFFGDPALRIYDAAPRPLAVTLSVADEPNVIVARSDGESVPNCHIVLSNGSSVLLDGTTDNQGRLATPVPLDPQQEYTITGRRDGYVTAYSRVRPSIATDVEDDSYGIPSNYALHQNYPNPFNPATTITFALPRRSHVDIRVYNLLGQQVAVLATGSIAAGIHTLTWDATDENGTGVASGVYFYRMETDDYVESRKMLLLR